MGRASSDVFLRSVVYDQFVMQGDIGRLKDCELTGKGVDCDFWDRHFLGEGVGEEKYAKIAVYGYGIVVIFLKVKAIFHLRLRLESRVLTQHASASKRFRKA